SDSIARADGNGEAANATATVAAPAHNQQRIVINPDELLPFVVQGMADELRLPSFGDEGVEALLVRRLPRWKRAIDIVGSATGVIILSPVMLLAAAAIK